MVKRSEEEWRVLFAEQASSGLTARHFCMERKLCPKYFSLRKKQLGWEAEEKTSSCLPSPFVRLERIPKEHPKNPRVVLRLGRCEWEFMDVCADWLVGLMRALA
jgi:hypothetical protein